MKTKIWHCMVSSTHHATCEGEMTGWNVREIWVWDTSCQSSWLPHIIWNTRQFYRRASPLVATVFLVLIVLSWPLASHASSLIRYIIAARPRRYQVILQHFIENCTLRIMHQESEEPDILNNGSLLQYAIWNEASQCFAWHRWLTAVITRVWSG